MPILFSKRFFSSIRQYIDTDVLIVGGGPAGLSAAIRLKQLNSSINIILLEKGPEIGSHIMSGVVFDPIFLDELLPDWKLDSSFPLETRVSLDKFKLLLSQNYSIPLPIPNAIKNTSKCLIGSLSQLTRWLGERALELGVEIYTGFAGANPIFSSSSLSFSSDSNFNSNSNKVIGIYTNDLGILRNGSLSSNYEMGVGIRARHTLLAEGAHGSLTKIITEKYGLRAKGQHQTFGLGLKEVWQIDKKHHQRGLVMHTLGWPLDSNTYGGSFMYHWADDLVSIGLVVGLDYKNPFLNPYQEFQKLKLHSQFNKILKGGTCQSYGARVINEGGWQSIPTLSFPGGALIGCSAGFLNVPRIKGSHLAMKSGMIAAQLIHEKDSLKDYDRMIKGESIESNQESEKTEKVEMKNKKQELKEMEIESKTKEMELELENRQKNPFPIAKELWQVRNIRPVFHKLGLYGGLLYSGMELMFLKGRVPWTFQHGPPDHQCLEPSSKHKEISYPKPDGEITFSLLDNVYRTGTFHREDQPSHLQLKESGRQEKESWPIYSGVESRFCPAGVYEYHYSQESNQDFNKEDIETKTKTDIGIKIETEIQKLDSNKNGNKITNQKIKFQINSQNCIHCKTCDIKDPLQNINWTVPEGGGGPKYTNL